MMQKGTEKNLAIGFGVLFIGLLLIIALTVPNPTPFQYLIFRVVLSLAAAGIAGTFSGFLQIEIHEFIKAGGALGVFVLVYCYNPVQLSASVRSTLSGQFPSADDIKPFESLSTMNAEEAMKLLSDLKSRLTTASDDQRHQWSNFLLSKLDDPIFRRPSDVLSDDIRSVRNSIAGTLLAIDVSAIQRCQSGELRGLDLVDMDFKGLDLRRLDFSSAFLLGTDFSGATLDGCNFNGAFVRNVSFKAASLKGVTFKDSDWFNAAGLDQDNLGSADRSTLMPFPKTKAARMSYLKNHYMVPFENWPLEKRQGIQNAWKEYGVPGGLGDTVQKWIGH
jgi:uncharacterized protein YjbI with pentapeptide repeats